MADFLSGSAIPAQTVATQSTALTSLPDWYSNYAKDIIDAQSAQAMTPYAAYNGPRVAALTPEQQQAGALVGQAANAYQPGLQQAQQVASSVAGNVSGLPAAQPYLDKSTMTAPQVVNDYLNPYQDAVVSRIGEVGTRNLLEDIIPGIRDKFISGGSYGGTRNAELFGRGVRQAQEGISAEQAKYLAEGYNSSLGAAQTDLARQGTLAQTAGTLAQTDTSQKIANANQLGTLAEMSQRLGLTGANALNAVGEQQRAVQQQSLDAAHEDFLRQQGYNQTQIDAMTKTLGSLAGALPKYTEEAGISPTGTTPTYAPSGFATGVGTAAEIVALAKTFGLI